MNRRFARPRRVPLLLLSAALPVALSGCPPMSASTVLPTTKSTDLAKLVPSATAVDIGASVRFDYAGSRSGGAGCPEYSRLFVDGVAVSGKSAYGVAGTPNGSGEFATLGMDGSCAVAAGAFDHTFAGQPGAHVVTVLLESYDDEELRQSTASVTVTVRASSTTTTPPPTTTPPAPPTGSPSPQPSDPPPATACEDRHTGGGATPDLHAYYVNPTPPVSGEVVLLGMRATDPDGTIVRYHYDTNGDGTFDRTDSSNEIALTAGAAGPIGFCMAAEDNSGNLTRGRLMVQVQPAGTLYGSALGGPAKPRLDVAETFGISASPPTAATHVVDWGDTQTDIRGTNAAGQTLNHTYTATGWYLASVTTADASSTSTWFYPVEVVSAVRPGGALRVRYDDGQASAAKTYELSAALSPKGALKVVSRGKVTYKDGVLATKGAVVKARAKGKLPSKLAKVKALKGLSALYDADFAVRFDGTRVLLGPETWGAAGKGVLLAQSRKSRTTRVCMSFTSDGTTLKGTKWTILGATGKARKLGGSGTYAPPVIGPRQGAAPTGSATIRTGKARGIAKCKSLVKVLR